MRRGAGEAGRETSFKVVFKAPGSSARFFEWHGHAEGPGEAAEVATRDLACAWQAVQVGRGRAIALPEGVLGRRPSVKRIETKAPDLDLTVNWILGAALQEAAGPAPGDEPDGTDFQQTLGLLSTYASQIASRFDPQKRVRLSVDANFRPITSHDVLACRARARAPGSDGQIAFERRPEPARALLSLTALLCGRQVGAEQGCNTVARAPESATLRAGAPKASGEALRRHADVLEAIGLTLAAADLREMAP